MIAVDLDGTLIGPEGAISPRNLQAIHAAERAGIEVVFATGRRHGYAMKLLRGLGIRSAATLVSSNGAVTRTIAADLIARSHLSRSTALWLCGCFGEFRNSLVITFDTVTSSGEDTRGALVVEDLADLHASIGRWMLANEPYLQQVVPIECALDAGDPIQMMLCGSVDRMRRAEARLTRDPRVLAVGASTRPGVEVVLNRTEYPERDLSILDILPAGCSKGVALLSLAASWDLSPAGIMAIGDNWNDLSMLEIAGRPVLMGNAPPELKELAADRGWRLTARNDEDGVALAIEHLLEHLPLPGLASPEPEPVTSFEPEPVTFLS